MRKIYYIIYLFIFSVKNISSSSLAIAQIKDSGEEIVSMTNGSVIDQLDERNKNNVNRIANILRIKMLYMNYRSFRSIDILFHDLCGYYFGLDIGLEEKNDDITFLERLVTAVNKFNIVASSDLKYLCDMKIKYILQNEKKILAKMKKDPIYDLLVTAYFFYLLLPNEYMNQGSLEIDVTEKAEEEFANIEEKINWQDANMHILIECSEIGMLHDGYLYKEFDQLIMKKLEKNKMYNDFLIIKKHYTKKIERDEYMMQIIEKKYLDLIEKYFFDLEEKALHEDRLGFLGSWLFNKENILTSIEKVLHPDFLFFLMLLIRLDNSIDILEQSYYKKVMAKDRKLLHDSAQYARVIVNNLFDILHIKKIVQWESLPAIVISQDRVNAIVNYLSNITLII